MAQHWRGAEPRWALGGAVLGVCLAGVAGQLVEVRQGGAEGLGGLSNRPGRGLGDVFQLADPFLLPQETWFNRVP